MKNVLFATTALVAFAGTAIAGSHGGASITGDIQAGYNDEIEGGLFVDLDVDLTATVDLGDSVTASASVELFSWDIGSLNAVGGLNFITAVGTPTIEIAYTGDTLSASLTFGDLGDKGASEYFYADRDGMAVDVENHDLVDNNADGFGDNDVRALVEFGNFGVAIGCGGVRDGECDGMNVGVGATFGSISVGLGYDEDYTDTDGVAPLNASQLEKVGVSVDAEFGAATVGVSYITSTAQDSIGVAVGYTVSEALSVAAYYADNTVADDAFGLSVAYAAGALTAGVYFDSATVDAFGVDVSYAVSDQLTANAGIYDDGVAADMFFYVGIDYAVNDNISATVSYANGDEISGPEYMDGISAYLSASF